MGKFRIVSLILLLSSLMILFLSCKKEKLPSLNEAIPPEQSEMREKEREDSFFNEEIRPITNSLHGQFSKVVGWLSKEEILYSANDEDNSYLISYNIYSGESKLLFEKDEQISDLIINPTLSYILINSSKQTNLANLTIINFAGQEIFNEQFESAELSFQWSYFANDDLIVSSFQEDWSFELFYINVSEGEIKQIEASDPFPQWLAKDKIGLLQWEPDQLLLTAPLKSIDIKDGKEEEIIANAIDFYANKTNLMTITVDEQDDNIGTYSFYNKNRHEPSSFTVALLTRYSGWLVPFYTFSNNDKQLFYTFRPYRSAPADLYGDKFELLRYDIVNNEDEVIIDDINNEPIALSPDGNMLLYGYEFEKIIRLDNNEVINFVNY